MISTRIINKFMNYVRLCQLKKKVRSIGRNVIIEPCHSIYGRNLIIKDDVVIGGGAWIAARPATGCESATLIIENGCTLGRFNEIYATKEIIIEKNVLTAERVYISDNAHGYDNPDIAIKDQPIKQNGTVRIGEGSWLGVGVCVLGVNIGKHCVIGANAVVTHDIPDYSVAVGIPAMVIKKYDFVLKQWVNL